VWQMLVVLNCAVCQQSYKRRLLWLLQRPGSTALISLSRSSLHSVSRQPNLLHLSGAWNTSNTTVYHKSHNIDSVFYITSSFSPRGLYTVARHTNIGSAPDREDTREVKRSSNFRTSVLKFEFEFDLNIFSTRILDWNLSTILTY